MSSPVQKKTSSNEGEPPAALVSPQKKSRRSIKDFKIGTKVQREFDDGKIYTARVMTEPQCVWDAERKKMVLSRLVRYYADNQEEWADENQLNEWAYDSDDSLNEGEENWANDATDEEEGDDDDSFLFVNLHNDEVLGGSKQKATSEARITTTSPVEIAPGSPTAPSKEGSSVESNEREASPEKSSDTLSEITASSVAGSSDKTCNETDGRRRSNRTRRQPDVLTTSRKAPRPDPLAGDKRNLGVVKKSRKEMEHVLLYKMGITKEETKYALDLMSPPYSQNLAINIIHKHRDKLGNLLQEEEEKVKTQRFRPEIGLKVRVPMGGSYWHGEVTSGPEFKIPEGFKEEVKMWEVTFDDGGIEDYDWNDLLKYRASRPIINCKGRTLNALELFCGQGIVTQEFCERKFSVKSIDIEPESYAMMVLDIRKIKYEDIGFVPDFIWASPPCTTFTKLTGGKHRNIKEGQFEKTQMAHDHNILFAQMVCIMNWAKLKNPNLIVVIENPEAQMQKAPMMIEFMKTFGLYKAKVTYCAFGREDMKPTNLWTNDFGLHNRLNYFQCSESTCPYYKIGHPIGTRENGQDYNAAAIPQKLAEEVADYVYSKFYMHSVARTPKITLSDEEKEEFNRNLSCTY